MDRSPGRYLLIMFIVSSAAGKGGTTISRRGRGRGGGREGGGGSRRATATAAAAAKVVAAATAAGGGVRIQARTRAVAGWGGVGWGARGGDPGRSLALHRRGTAEGSARLDVVEKTSVEGLLLPFLYQKLYEYHQKHLAVLAVQREMENNFRMHAENGGNHGVRASIIAPRLRYQAPSHDARYQSPT